MIYLHVPFCGSFCVYCGFYSELCAKADFNAYLSDILAEIRSRAAEIRDTEGTKTLYIGGGTPSVLPLAHLESIIQELRKVSSTHWEEFTMEVNPEDIVALGPEYAAALRDLGVNRISMGVQSLDDGMLRWMNRRHDSARAREAFTILRNAGFDNISVDVIFGINGLSDTMLSGTLNEICSCWKPEHISAYQLSIDEESVLAGKVDDGSYAEADEELCRRQYDLICRQLRESGYIHYEISNWARPGREAVHNSAYWTRSPYVGLGPGAHSLQIKKDGSQIRSWNSLQPSSWTSSCEQLSAEEIREEEIMLGLRTAAGWKGRVIPEEDWFVADSIIAGLI